MVTLLRIEKEKRVERNNRLIKLNLLEIDLALPNDEYSQFAMNMLLDD